MGLAQLVDFEKIVILIVLDFDGLLIFILAFPFCRRDGQEVQQVAQFNPLVVEIVEFFGRGDTVFFQRFLVFGFLGAEPLAGILDFRGGFRNHHEQGSHDRGVQHEVEFVRVVVLRDFTFAYFPAEFLGNQFLLVFMDQDRRGIVFHLFPNVFFLVAQVLGRFVQQ